MRHSASEPQSGGDTQEKSCLKWVSDAGGQQGTDTPADPLHIIYKVCVFYQLLCSPSRANKPLRQTDGHLVIFYFS